MREANDMIQANLIPIPRRLARLRHRRVRQWVTVCSLYSVLLVAAYGALQAVWGHGDQVLERDVVTISNEISVTDKEVKSVTPKLNEARLTLAASLAVGSQPDWSVLLALLAAEMREEGGPAEQLLEQAMSAASASLGAPRGLEKVFAPALEDATKQIVLSSCELTPIAEVAAPTGASVSQNLAATQPRYTLALSGMGRSQAVISQYVLRLEQTGLFNRVTLIESRKAPFARGEAITFRIGCTMGGEGK